MDIRYDKKLLILNDQSTPLTGDRRFMYTTDLYNEGGTWKWMRTGEEVTSVPWKAGQPEFDGEDVGAMYWDDDQQQYLMHDIGETATPTGVICRKVSC